MADADSSPKPYVKFDPPPMESRTGGPPESGLSIRLKAARDHYGMSVDALSRLTKLYDYPEERGVSATAALRYESGEALPAARELRILSEALGVSVDWLIFGRSQGQQVSAADEALLVALRRFFGELATRRDLGEQMAITLEQASETLRAQRITEAKRKPT